MSRTYQYYRDLVVILTQKEIKIRYKNNVLGYLWSVAQPLAFAFVYFFAFKVIMRIPMREYTLFLISGLFPWQWFSNSVVTSTGSLAGNASLIKKLSFHRYVLPLANVFQDMVHFLLAVPVIVFFVFYYHRTPSWIWLYALPLQLVVQILMAYGLSLLISSIALFLRDMERLVSIAITLFFYFTPIIYQESMIPEPYRQWALILNPLTALMINWRSMFMENQFNFAYFGLSLVYGLGMFLLGFTVFQKLSPRFAEVL